MTKNACAGFACALLPALLLCTATSSFPRDPDVLVEPLRSFGLGSLEMAALSPDGSRMATAGQSGAFLWNFNEGVLEHRLDQHRALITAAVFSPDSRWLLTGDREGLIHCWDAAAGGLARSFAGHAGEISGLAFAPDGTAFISASLDRHARTWSLDSGEQLHDLEFPTWVTSVAWAPDGRHVAIGQGATTNLTRLWNLETASPLSSFLGHAGDVRKTTFLPDGRFVTAGDDGTVRIWQAGTGEELRLLPVGHSIPALHPSADGSVLFTSGDATAIRAWSVESGELLQETAVDPMVAFTLVPGANQALLAGADNLLRVVDLETGGILRTFSGHTSSSILGLQFSPDGQSILSGGGEKPIRLWDRRQATVLRTFPGEGWGTTAAAFSPDGSRILTTAGPSHRAIIWNAETGTIERDLRGHSSWILNAVFSSSGQFVATGSQDLTVRLWDAATGSNLWRFTPHDNWVRALAFSPDDRLLVTGSEDGTARIWDLQTRQLLHTLEGHFAGVKQAAFAPGGSELMTASEEAILRFWDPATGSFLRQIEIPGGFLNAARYSPNGDFILTGEGWPFYVARLFDARSGEPLRVFAGNTAPVNSVAFDPSGTLVATGGDLLRLWSIADLAPRLRLENHGSELTLTWSAGLLEQAPAPTGPWQCLPEAVSPLAIPRSSPDTFFRVSLPIEPQ